MAGEETFNEADWIAPLAAVAMLRTAFPTLTDKEAMETLVRNGASGLVRA